MRCGAIIQALMGEFLIQNTSLNIWKCRIIVLSLYYVKPIKHRPMKLNISSLVVEVTRRCNMSCEHCLRGDAQNKNIDFKHIDSLLSQCESIGTVTFTGGEPSMNVPAIDYFLKKAKELSIPIDGFYIATNGLKITEEFILVCLRLFSYSGCKELCSVHVSNDTFHANEGNYNTELLDGLSFFGRKFSEEGYDYNGYRTLIGEGRAKDNFGDTRKIYITEIKTKDSLNETDVVLNCNGQIINGCDWSYASQKKHMLCGVDKLEAYYDSLPVE
jgi:hypothetical protein